VVVDLPWVLLVLEVELVVGFLQVVVGVLVVLGRVLEPLVSEVVLLVDFLWVVVPVVP
jgi:hypothetical protein